MKNRILIVDDVELNREMLALMLGNKYDFLYAKNGIEAIEILGGDKSIDLILLDVNMPDMDGFEVLRIMNERHWIDEFPVIIISAEDSTEYITRAYQLGVSDFLSRPFRTIIVQRRVENTLSMYANQKKLIKVVENQIWDREKVSNSMINIFSNIIELRNHESGSHTLNVQKITGLLLHKLVEMTGRYNISSSDIALISSLSALHDIGKIKIPESVLNKPGKLTPDEWELMKTHTTEGEKILKASDLDQNSKFARTARNICRWHHEKYDGKGYPDGLVGDNIPIEAQVVSLADVYDALTSERCYKKAFSHDEAIRMILGGECGAFNPLLLKCLEEVSDVLGDIKKSIENGFTIDEKRDVALMTDEILGESKLPQENTLRRLLNNEKKKKEFFMDCADGIQFEYDKLLHKTIFVNLKVGSEGNHKVMFTTRDSEGNILIPKYWDKLRSCLVKTTKENPIVETDLELLLDGVLVPYHAKAMAVWPEIGNEYISVLGHFTPINKQTK